MTDPEPHPTNVTLRLLAAAVAILAGMTAIVIALLYLKGALA
jgi:hypothetical protein